MKTVLLVLVVVVVISAAGCANALHGAALDAHGYTGWAVESTAGPMRRSTVRDIRREQKLLNERIENAGWLRRLQGTKIE